MHEAVETLFVSCNSRYCPAQSASDSVQSSPPFKFLFSAFAVQLQPDMTDQYEELGIIGKGSFGLIRKVRRKKDGKILVRKEISYKQMSTAQKKQLVTEVNLLRELKHPNIVRYYERIVDKENCIIYIIMEYCEGGDLGHVIRRCKKEGKVVCEEIVWNVLAQVLAALVACHSGQLTKSGVVLHRDIKPENVFLDAFQNVKLGDFGLSRVLNQTVDFASTYVGTPFYMSPELINETVYDTKSDIWSLGCLVYELCSLNPPFQAASQNGLYNKISSGKFTRLPSRYSDELDRIVKSMLQVNQDLRPSAKELFQHERVELSYKKVEVQSMEKYLLRKEVEMKEVLEELRKKEAWLNEKELALSEREHELQRRELEIEVKSNSALQSSVIVNSLDALEAEEEEVFKSPSLMIFSPAVRKSILESEEANYNTTPTRKMSNAETINANMFKFSPSSYFPSSSDL
jgi:NIMA (never in mitosis gene a)-related kinase 2